MCFVDSAIHLLLTFCVPITLSYLFEVIVTSVTQWYVFDSPVVTLQRLVGTDSNELVSCVPMSRVSGVSGVDRHEGHCCLGVCSLGGASLNRLQGREVQQCFFDCISCVYAWNIHKPCLFRIRHSHANGTDPTHSSISFRSCVVL